MAQSKCDWERFVLPQPFFLLASCQLISPACSDWAGGFLHLNNELVENHTQQSCGHHLEDALPSTHKVKMGQCT